MIDEKKCCSRPDYRWIDSQIQNDGFDNFYRVNGYTCISCGEQREISTLIPEDDGKKVSK